MIIFAYVSMHFNDGDFSHRCTDDQSVSCGLILLYGLCELYKL